MHSSVGGVFALLFFFFCLQLSAISMSTPSAWELAYYCDYMFTMLCMKLLSPKLYNLLIRVAHWEVLESRNKSPTKILHYIEIDSSVFATSAIALLYQHVVCFIA